jgi:hypothetical protein
MTMKTNVLKKKLLTKYELHHYTVYAICFELVKEINFFQIQTTLRVIEI